MKKFIIAACAAAALIIICNAAVYRFGFYIDIRPDAPVTSFMKTAGKTVLMERDGEYRPFEIRGVDLGAGIPGKWATDFAIDKKTYLRWFRQIKELGANTVRVYTILHDDFYNAFYEYNKDNGDPLYLIQGVWVSDYALFSHMDAYDEEFITPFIEDCRAAVDVIHGKRSLGPSNGNKGSGSYRRNVAPWVIGYILGVEWEDYTVTYTDQADEGRTYSGDYMYTSKDATPFEAFLAKVGDEIIGYETKRYKEQRLVAFANWPSTDPFVYPGAVIVARQKLAAVDVEHIKTRGSFISGMFASYHVYPYFPDYLEIMRDTASLTDGDMAHRLGNSRWYNIKYRRAKLKGPKIEDYLKDENYIDSYGRYNTYLAYLKALTAYHTLPVVISEYGVSTGRCTAQTDLNTGRNQGHMSEKEQGRALIDCYKDIMDAGCAGSCIFSWQDEWFKRTWNTMHAVDLDKTPYWSDYQTNEQYFGLLSFDPGKEKSICYVDGDTSDWNEQDAVIPGDELSLSMKYDEKFIYFLIRKKDFDTKNDSFYIPIDLTPKSGSRKMSAYGLSFQRPTDFLILINDQKGGSRVMVQERYEVLKAIYGVNYYGYNPYCDPPAADSPRFVDIQLPLTLDRYVPDRNSDTPAGTKFDTGLLRRGNGNPDSPDFDSLADYTFGHDCVELRIPWQLLNFSNPSEMRIHDDYYEKYGIENLSVSSMYVGLSTGGGEEIPMTEFPLTGWGKKVNFHERLKSSYYELRDYWRSIDGEAIGLGD